STRKMGIIRVTAGKPCKISVMESSARRAGKCIRDSAYPAIEQIISETTVIEMAIANELSVTVQILAVGPPMPVPVRKFQLSKVQPPKLPLASTGKRPLVRVEKVATISHRYPT